MQPGGVRDLKAMLTGMDPVLGDGAWCFQPLRGENAMLPDTAFALIREEEGACAILPAPASDPEASRYARITLSVLSDLDAIGLSGTVATALATSGIACNIIAGLRHDYLFVPWERRGEALELLRKISLNAHR